jgi:hypothetical protein
VLDLQTLLETYSAELIILGFPNFDPIDTIGISLSGEYVRLPDLRNIVKIRFPPETDILQVCLELREIPEILFADPNGMAEPLIEPNDEKFPSQWNLKDANDHDIDGPEAWDITTGSSSIKIAILDGGVENWHDDLEGKVTGDAGWGWFGHGFHVAGIAAANTNNEVGISGVDWNARIIAKRVDNTDDLGMYQAVMDAISSGAQITNNSWSLKTPNQNPRYSSIVRLAFRNAYLLGLLSTVAMGNTDAQLTNYPAGFGKGTVVAVGATDGDDRRVTTSNGYTWGSCWGNHIDVVAPGIKSTEEGIWSTVPYDPWYEQRHGNMIWGGTSMATPHVSGLAGLLRAYANEHNFNDLSNDDLEWIIRVSADNIPEMQGQEWTQYHGDGRINARRALDIIKCPYQYWRLSASGGSDYNSTDWYGMWFPLRPREPHIQSGWKVKRHEVRKTISLPQPDFTEKWAWGRKESNGWHMGDPTELTGEPYQWEEGWCEVVSLMSNSLILRTYVYEVQKVNNAGQGYGDIEWWPTTPSNVTFAYTVLGRRFRLYSPPDRSGFETHDPEPYEHFIIDYRGINNFNAYVAHEDNEPINAYRGNKMYKITGYDFNGSGSGNNDYISFHLFDCNIPMTSQTFLSFWVYIYESPGHHGRIVLEGQTASNDNLRDWTTYGLIIDQFSQDIHPGRRTIPEGEWVYLLFNLSPAMGEVLTGLSLMYHDQNWDESGWFTAYIDDMRIRTDQQPPRSEIGQTWYPEVFATGPPGDPNFVLRFSTNDYEESPCNGGARIIVDNGGNGGEGEFWVMPPPSIRRRRYGCDVHLSTNIRWRQWDKEHALILSLLFRCNDGAERWLHYAKNASNWWEEEGWVHMGEPGQYNIWQDISRNIYTDFMTEYDAYDVTPELVRDFRISHFCFTSWQDDHGGVVSDIVLYEDPLSIPPVRFDRATFPNNGELLLFDTHNRNIHIAYNTGETFMYRKTADYGETWEYLTEVDTGSCPSVVLDSSGLPRITYLKNDTVFCQIMKPDSTWDTAVVFGYDQSQKPKEPALAPSYPPELANYSYSTFTTTDDPMGVNSKINLSIFDVTEDIAPPVNEVATGDSLKSPSIAITPGDYVHIVWEQKGDIYYRTSLQPLDPEEEIVWSDIFNVSVSPMVYSEHPVVEAYGENIIVAWKEGNPGEIYRRIRNINSDIADWLEIENISQSSTQESDYPVLSTQDVVAWQEQIDSLNYEIYAWIQGDIVNISETENSSKYPHIAVEPQDFTGDTITPAIVINTIWTETVIPDSLYEVRFKRYEHTQGADGISGMIEYISVSVGDSLASPYCKKRDGFIQYGEYSLDYSRSSLVYNLPYLKPQSSYLVRALVYQGERDRWRERMYIDDSLTADVYIDPKIPRMVNIVLPKASFGTDLEINKEIRKILGRIAIVADLKVYEVNLPDTIGDKEGALANREDLMRYALYQNRPNPFKDFTKISFALPRECNVSLFIYDITGRRVRTLINGKLELGDYNYTWDGKDNRNRRLTQGVYFYRLQTDDFKDTKKTVLLK